MMQIASHPAIPSDWLVEGLTQEQACAAPNVHACSPFTSAAPAIEEGTRMHRMETIILGGAHLLLAILILVLVLQ
jgi:hypothetical protein